MSGNIFFSALLLMTEMNLVTSERNSWPAGLINFQTFMDSGVGGSAVDVVMR